MRQMARLFRSFVIGVLAAVCWVATPSAAQEAGYIARTLHQPVPGGVAAVPLGVSDSPPVIQYNGARVMVVKDSDAQWVAVVGIDLKAQPGRHTLKVGSGTAAVEIQFQVNHKEYASQHIKLKNRAHVSPDPEQLKRYRREHAEQMDAYARIRVWTSLWAEARRYRCPPTAW